MVALVGVAKLNLALPPPPVPGLILYDDPVSG